jgi:hypothetical protein
MNLSGYPTPGTTQLSASDVPAGGVASHIAGHRAGFETILTAANRPDADRSAEGISCYASAAC